MAMEEQKAVGSRIFGFFTALVVPPVKVEQIPNNGAVGYTVVVGKVEPTCYTIVLPSGARGYPILQIDVNLEREGMEIHLCRGPYGPDVFFPLSQLEEQVWGRFKQVLWEASSPV